jgi:large subunit ribosomal protein L22
MEIKASLNYLRMSPRKVRLVAALIRNMDVKRAEVELVHLRKRASAPLLKLLRSAVANAKKNFELPEAGLYIKRIVVNEGPVFKRFRARAFGRAAPLRKKTSHINLVLDTGIDLTRGPKERKNKLEPVVREATAEDLREEKIKETSHAESREAVKRPQVPGFVRRVFRRKAI